MENQRTEIVTKTAKRIKFLRKDRGLSQESFALAAGLNIAYIGNIERCLKCPTIDTLNEISIQNLSDEDAMRIAEIVTEIVKIKG